MIDMYISNGKKSKLIDLDNLKPEDFDIEYIAHSLSIQGRFNGHTPKLYSVAQHSVYVSKVVNHFSGIQSKLIDDYYILSLYALLHDVHEMIIGDITSPIQKRLDIKEEVDYFAYSIDSIIWKSFNLPEPSFFFKETIKTADSYMCNLELNKFFMNNDRINHPEYPNVRYPYIQLPIKPTIGFPIWNPSTAKREFLSRFEYLQNKLKR